MRCHIVPRTSLLLLLVLTLGCAANPGAGSSTGSSRDVLDSEALATLTARDAYDAVRQLRPRWLRGRSGETPVVFVNELRQPGGLDMLRSIPLRDIGEIRYVSASDATTRWGTGFTAGAIMIALR